MVLNGSSTDLPPGTWTITMTVTDDDGETSSTAALKLL